MHHIFLYLLILWCGNGLHCMSFLPYQRYLYAMQAHTPMHVPFNTCVTRTFPQERPDEFVYVREQAFNSIVAQKNMYRDENNRLHAELERRYEEKQNMEHGLEALREENKLQHAYIMQLMQYVERSFCYLKWGARVLHWYAHNKPVNNEIKK